jgi:excisionase family DNA binding protein
MEISPDMLTLKEAAARLGVKTDHVTRLIERGELEAINVAIGRKKRCLRVSEKSINDFLNGRRIKPQMAQNQTSRVHSSLAPGVLRICG